MHRENHKYFRYLSDYKEERELWLIEGLLCNSLTLLSGEPKSGKSMLAVHMAKSLISGETLLDCQPLTGNHKIGWVGYDANWQSETKGRLGEFSSQVISFDPPRISDPEWNWNQIASKALEHSCSLIVIDHLYGLSDNFNLDHAHEAKAVLSKIRPLYTDFNLPTLLIAQAGKGSFGRAAHSVQLEGEARHLLQLEGRGTSGNRKLKIISNNFKAGTYKILLSPDSCQVASPGKEAEGPKVKRERDAEMPNYARRLMNTSNVDHRKSASSLARFDLSKGITGRTTFESSRTYINHMIKGGLLERGKNSKLISPGPKLRKFSELN